VRQDHSLGTTPAVTGGLEGKPWSLEKDRGKMTQAYWRKRKRRANRRVAVAVRLEINVHSLGRLSADENRLGGRNFSGERLYACTVGQLDPQAEAISSQEAS